MKRLLRRNYEQAVAPHVASGLVDEQVTVLLLLRNSQILLHEHVYRCWKIEMTSQEILEPKEVATDEQFQAGIL